MSAVYDLYITTQKLDKAIEIYRKKQENREKTISIIKCLLDDREKLIAVLPSHYTQKEKIWGQEMVKVNERINKGLTCILNDIKDDRLQLKRKREFSNKYYSVYQGMSTDGVFLDKRE
ncbi:hypothetical protein JOD45_001237 [Scopulibacillus daqui]|uniref:Flagellar protein FliT n=1 Tax=Scopulibacillus daqui TaxID=1469162 RepID=A0ABS2PY96_9BACL|nr:hypothetical protein [Scopulibacillus daqui]MBM7645028.1 hypothetical protein [Scopulibacillus daqui]